MKDKSDMIIKGLTNWLRENPGEALPLAPEAVQDTIETIQALKARIEELEKRKDGEMIERQDAIKAVLQEAGCETVEELLQLEKDNEYEWMGFAVDAIRAIQSIQEKEEEQHAEKDSPGRPDPDCGICPEDW